MLSFVLYAPLELYANAHVQEHQSQEVCMYQEAKARNTS
jgi:hypothetical protein